ncbi:MAG: DUF4358 domain-containing protein [Oscillospiraceae bacterium]|nr:DUF4358 domain-containing protein [Oscillospiraceae bacterium]
MKKFFALFVCAVMAVSMFASCGGKKEETPESSAPESSAPAADPVPTATAEEIFAAIDAAFVEEFSDLEATGAISNMPMDVDDTVLTEKFGIDPADVESYKGQIAGMMTNCDMLMVVKAKEGKMDAVLAGLEKAKADQTTQFEFYPVAGNDLRLEASKIVQNGDYAALLMVGVVDNDAPDFTDDVKMAEDAFNTAIEESKK